jgi:outer membrane protein
MKKVSLVLFFLSVVTTVSWGQFTQGNILLGGTTGLSANFMTEKSKSGGTTSTDGKQTSFSLQPAAGYFVMDNLAVGAALDLSTSSFKPDGGGGKRNLSQLLLSPFARYYFDKFYGQASINFGSSKEEFSSGNVTVTDKNGLSGWSLAGGYAFFLNESVTFEPQIGYGSLTSKDKDTDNKDISAGLFIRLGVFVYLVKNSK